MRLASAVTLTTVPRALEHPHCARSFLKWNTIALYIIHTTWAVPKIQTDHIMRRPYMVLVYALFFALASAVTCAGRGGPASFGDVLWPDRAVTAGTARHRREPGDCPDGRPTYHGPHCTCVQSARTCMSLNLPGAARSRPPIGSNCFTTSRTVMCTADTVEVTFTEASRRNCYRDGQLNQGGADGYTEQFQ